MARGCSTIVVPINNRESNVGAVCDNNKWIGKVVVLSKKTDKKKDKKTVKKSVNKTVKKAVKKTVKTEAIKKNDHTKTGWKPGNMLYPVPAVMISCKSEGEKPNILTVAWAGTVCSDPAMVSISVRPSRHSYSMIKESGEFVINLVSTELTRACDWCGVKSGRDFDKFAEMNLTPYESEFMAAPAIKESPVNIYCKVKQELPLGTHNMFIAEVVGVTADEAYMDESGRFDMDKIDLMAYSHGTYYSLGKKLGTFGYSVKKKA